MKYIIEPGNELSGTVNISGSKNACLPIIAASLLCEKTIIENAPKIGDIYSMIDNLKHHDVDVFFDNRELVIENKEKIEYITSHNDIKKLRASFVLLGPILAREGKCVIPLPGGCVIGNRPVDIHLDAFKQMGASIEQTDHTIKVRCQKLKGADIKLKFPSIGATQNIMMAAVKAEGTTTIENAAKEPEVVDLGNFLIKTGAEIEGLGSEKIIINGVDELKSVSYKVIPDRIEAGSFLIMNELFDNKIDVDNYEKDHLKSLFNIIKKIKNNDDVEIKALPYPGFPTDLQALMVPLLASREGGMIADKVFPQRFRHLEEFKKMGLDYSLKNNEAVIKKSKITGANVNAVDLRAGAALVIAGLIAKGTTEVNNVELIQRGYEDFDEKLKSLGVDIDIKK